MLASIIGGALWSAFSPQAALYFGATCTVAAVVVMLDGRERYPARRCGAVTIPIGIARIRDALGAWLART